MDVKARSKAMREILTRLVDIEQGGVEVKIFGDVVILEEGELRGESSCPQLTPQTSRIGRKWTYSYHSSRPTSRCRKHSHISSFRIAYLPYRSTTWQTSPCCGIGDSS